MDNKRQKAKAKLWIRGVVGGLVCLNNYKRRDSKCQELPNLGAKYRDLKNYSCKSSITLKLFKS